MYGLGKIHFEVYFSDNNLNFNFGFGEIHLK